MNVNSHYSVERAQPWCMTSIKLFAKIETSEQTERMHDGGNAMSSSTYGKTHEVTNQAPPLERYNALSSDPALHRYLLAYASDYSFVTTSLLPHAVNWITPGMQVASLDHVMWFHEPVRVDEWLLYDMESPSAHGGRGFARGRVFTRDGRLVASTSQEGLIRRRRAS